MSKEKLLIYFEQLEPTGKKRKKHRSNPFEYNVEIPKGVSSLEKSKSLSEHKEIFPLIKKLDEIKENEKKDNEEEKKEEQQLIDQLTLTKCPKCSSENVEESDEEGFLKCVNCKYVWEEEE